MALQSFQVGQLVDYVIPGGEDSLQKSTEQFLIESRRATTIITLLCTGNKVSETPYCRNAQSSRLSDELRIDFLLSFPVFYSRLQEV